MEDTIHRQVYKAAGTNAQRVSYGSFPGDPLGRCTNLSRETMNRRNCTVTTRATAAPAMSQW